MSREKTSYGFGRDGAPGGFARPAGSTLGDGTVVAEVFDEIADTLTRAGYHKAWVDGWKRDTDGAIVTCGYSYREVRIRRYLPGHKEKSPQAIHNVRRFHDLDRIEAFVGPEVGWWGPWTVDGELESVL